MAKNEKKERKTLSKKSKIIRSLIVIAIFTAVIVLAYYVLVWTGAWEYINSVDKIRQLILSMGFWGRFAFVMLQFLQVTFLPIPSTISTLAGVLIYGPLQTALLSLAGIMLGSVSAFWLGRQFGRKLVAFMVGEETCKKWSPISRVARTSRLTIFLPNRIHRQFRHGNADSGRNHQFLWQPRQKMRHCFSNVFIRKTRTRAIS